MIVAELQTILTADDTGLSATLGDATKAREAFDGSTAEAQLLADASKAVQSVEAAGDKMTGVARAEYRARLEADAVSALHTLADLSDELNDINRTRTEAEIEADAAQALAEADKVGTELKRLNDEEAIPKVDLDVDGFDAGVKRASEGMGHLKDESNQTAREAAASFSGDPVDALDALQEVAANALGGFGPIGAAAGLALAAGIGIATSKLQEVADEANKAREKVGELTNEIIDAGGDLTDLDLAGKVREWAVELDDQKSWWEVWQEEATSNLDTVRKSMDLAGESFADVLGAMSSGDLDKADAGLSRLRGRVGDLNKASEDAARAAQQHVQYVVDGIPVYDEAGQALLDQADALQEQSDAISNNIGPLQRQIDEMRQAQEDADLLAAATEGVTVEQYKMQRAIDDANDALQEAGGVARDAAQAHLDLEQKIADTTATMSDAESTDLDRRQALLDLADQIAATAESEEAAQGTTKAYNDVMRENRQRFLDAAAAADITGQAAEDLADQYGLVPDKVETDLNANDNASPTVAEAQANIDALRGKTVDIKVNWNARSLRNALGLPRPGSGTVLLPGHKAGGYTGDVGVDDVAGVVHGREFVVNARATAANRPLLEAMNAGLPGYRGGGYVNPAPSAEAFVPTQSGVILPNGAGLGSVVNNIQVTTTSDHPERVAAAVGSELAWQMRR